MQLSSLDLLNKLWSTSLLLPSTKGGQPCADRGANSPLEQSPSWIILRGASGLEEERFMLVIVPLEA